ncbi:MAG: trypsin-like peptidase domain-containing protein [Anaerolineales bacterium]
MSPTENNQVLAALSDAMADAVEKAAQGTVLINARRRFPASGIVYAPDLVLTASHVLERDEDIPVITPNGEQLKAALVGRDPGSDLAVIRTESTLSAVIEPATQDARVGQLVLALGRPTEDGIQASLGVVSAVNGPVHTRRGGVLEGHIRTDAIPYPGFSGGPLVDAAGQVLGLNTSGLTRGASLAIPGKLVWQIAESLVKHGSVRRGYLGVRSQPVEIPLPQQDGLGRQQATGLLLVGVEPNSPAAESGLMVGDILTGFAGTPVTEPDDLFTRLAREVVGQPVMLEILRAGQKQEVTVTIGERN